MKTLYKFTIVLVLAFICLANITAINSGSITMTNTDWIEEYDEYYEYYYYYKSYTLIVSPNTPIKINYTLYTFDNFTISTNDNGVSTSIISKDTPTNGNQSVTVISSTGLINITANYNWTGNEINPVFILNYDVDPTYSITTNPSIINNDQLITGKLGIGITPQEKLHLNGSIRGNASGGALRVNTESGYLDLGSMNGGWAHIYTDRPSFILNKPIWSIGGEFSAYQTSNLKLQTNGMTRMTISATNGNVGIGTLNPTSKLHIEGDIYATGVLKSNNMVLGAGNNQYIFHSQDWLPNNPPKLYLAPRNESGTGWIWDKSIIFDNTGSILVTGGKLSVGTSDTSKGRLTVNGDMSTLTNAGKIGFNVTDAFTAFSSSNAHYGISYNGTQTPLVLSGYYGLGLFTDGTEKLRVGFNGNIGIGTTDPREKLDVRGNLYLNSGTDKNSILWGGHYMTMGTPEGDYAHNVFALNPGGATQGQLFSVLEMYTTHSPTNHERKVVIHSESDSYFNGGNVGIGTTTPIGKFDVQTAPNQHIQIKNDVNGTLPGCVGIVSINDGNTDYTPMGFYASKYYFGNGKVGIGTTKPTDLLSVNGIIRAKEVKIDLCEDLADFVFSPDYSLMPLHKVEAFVKTNKHLPEIPSAAEVKEKGLSIGEMQNKLLQKIEELTLYVIEQQKQIEQQNAKIVKLENSIKH